MPLRQLRNLRCDVGKRALQIGPVEVRQAAIEVQRVLEVLEHPRVIEDVAELLSLVYTVHSSDSLEQGVILERPSEVEHHVARRVEPGKEFVDDDDDLGLGAMLEAVNQLLVVLDLSAKPVHRLLPELVYVTAVLLVDVRLSLSIIGRRYQD